MTYEFRYLMEALSYSAVGRSINAPKQTINWNYLINLADKQNVLPMLTYAIKNLDSSIIPDSKKQLCFQRGRQIVIEAQVRKLNVMSLLSALEKEKIDSIILKGFSLSNYYYLPDTRVSGDTDIYINKIDERRTLNFMCSLGFQISKRQANSHHSECYTAATGMIEIHSELYHKKAREIWFSNLEADKLIKENYIDITDCDGMCKTLGYTDNVIYLSLHLIKHFIPSRISLRQLLDVSLFYFKNYEEIDTDRYWGLLKELHYDSLVAALLTISIKHCAFPFEWTSLIQVQSSRDMEEILLEDIENGCNYKSSESDGRFRSGIKYSRIIGDKRLGKIPYLIYIYCQKSHLWVSRFFSSIGKIENKYPILIQHKTLTPFIWFYHVFIHAPINIATRRTNKDRLDEQNICMDRLEMFRKLKML